MKRSQIFNILVEVDLESVVINSEYVEGYTIKDDIECSLEEGNFIIVDNNNLSDDDDINYIVDNDNELTDIDLQDIVDRYVIEKRLKSVTE